jgi:hypothetical protein
MSRRCIPLACRAAVAEALDPALVCALIEQESEWNPWTARYQQAAFSRLVVPLLKADRISISEGYARCFHWGLTGVLGHDAREAGFSACYLSTLCEVGENLAIGCKVLRKKFDLAGGGDTVRALLLWADFQSRERGRRYVDEVLHRRSFWAEHLSRRE